MADKTFQVSGMTCGHCEMSVQEEISEIAGVTAVNADSKTGRVEVSGEFTDAEIAAAITEAGFTLQV